jgi:PAS domain S-box-containing protein
VGGAGRSGAARSPWLSQRTGAVVGAGAVLVALVAYLLWANYREASRNRQQVLAQHQAAFRLHASALAHLLGSAGEDLRYLADSREVAAYFEGRDLGMSMQYGLGLALVPIRARLQRMVGDRGQGREPRFARVALRDADGLDLAAAGEPFPSPPASPPSAEAEGALVELDAEGCHLIVSRPLWFRGRKVGKLVGWVRRQAVARALRGDRLVFSDDSRLRLLDPVGRSYDPFPQGGEGFPDGLADLPADGRLVELADPPGQPTRGGPWLAQRLDVPGQPLTLVDVDLASELVGAGSPGSSALLLTLAAMLVLGGVVYAAQASSQALALRIRLVESQRREAEVAEKHAALERVERERRRLWQAVSQSPALVVITDQRGRVEYVNPAFERITGHTGEDVTGSRVHSLLALPGADPEGAAPWGELAGGRAWHGEVAQRRAGGEPLWVSLTISPARDELGEITHHIAIGEDVTARRAAAAELLRARDAAEAASKAKSAFLANMSHEIRTPLNAVLGYAQLVARDESLSPVTRRNVEVINRSGEHLLALLNDVLEISKIEAGRSTLDPVTFELPSLLRDLEALFVLRARGKGLSFEVRADPGLPRFLTADEGKVRQVLVNLLGNAVKFTAQGSVSLRISGERDGEALRIRAEVADTGAGIGAEELGRLFQEFEQTASGRLAQSGTGLGLAISRAHARLMGGDVSVASERGQGSRFTFSFPARVAEGGACSAEARRVVGLTGAGPAPRLLVADDQETNRDWLRQVLEAVGFEVREAADGREALAACAGDWPDLVLMDLRMPVMDGTEATRALRAAPDRRRVPILALTASAVGEERDAILAAGADAILRKPIPEPELLRAIGAHLGIAYRYADPDAPEATAPPAGATDLSVLPAGAREAMRDASRRGDMDRLHELIEEVATSSAPAAASLRALASRFDYEAIQRALA